MTTRKKSLITAIVVVGVAALLLIQHQTRTKLREENQSLQQRVDPHSNLVAVAEGSETIPTKRWSIPRLPAPPQAAAPPVESSLQDSQSNNVMARLLRGDAFPPKVRTEQIEARQKVSDQDWIIYRDRWRAFGEEAALQWLVGKYGQR